MNVIEIRDLFKRYRGSRHNALDGISFDVADGQLFCLLGPNGAGARYTRPELLLDATDRDQLRNELAAIGLTVQGTAPFRVPLGGRNAQQIVGAISSELTVLAIVEPTLEETYLKLVESQGP